MVHGHDEQAAGPIPVLDRIDHEAKSLDRAVRLTQMADAKTAPLLAVNATIAAVTVSQSGALGDLLDFNVHADGLVALAALLIAAYVALALVAVILGIFVYLPRAPRTSLVHHHEGPAPTSLVYFDDIRRLSFDEYQRRTIDIGALDLEQDILRQVHTVSGVASVKMGYVRYALLSTIGAFLAWLPLIAWAQA